MEQGRLTVLGKRSRDRFDNETTTWDEEKAFAEDAATVGLLGGCVWPPRSYFCSFCNREFKSAQALGGHMNIHRRDRAKLKQIPRPHPHPHPRRPIDCSNEQIIKNHGEINDFCFDFTNPNSVNQKMSKPRSQLTPSTQPCRENIPSFSSGLKQKSYLSLSRVCKLTKHSKTVVEKEVSVEDNESEDQIIEVNGIETCLVVSDLDLELRLGDRPKICKCDGEQTISTKSLS